MSKLSSQSARVSPVGDGGDFGRRGGQPGQESAGLPPESGDSGNGGQPQSQGDVGGDGAGAQASESASEPAAAKRKARRLPTKVLAGQGKTVQPGSDKMLNPQPLPPKVFTDAYRGKMMPGPEIMLNPQPLPPKQPTPDPNPLGKKVILRGLELPTQR